MTNFLITKPPQEPKLEDFGLSEEIVNEQETYKSNKWIKEHNLAYSSQIFFIIFVFFLFYSHGQINSFVSFFYSIFTSLWLGAMIGFFVALFLIQAPFSIFQGLFPNFKEKEFKIFEEKYKEYQKAYKEYESLKRAYDDYIQSKKREYWFSLSGHDFEYKFANLYKSLGYKAEVTKGSGDAGIDIILEKDGEKYCVQCKAHKKPVGPAIVRELYGAMHSAGIRQGILVCLGGFTSGVYDFVKDKPIKLVDIDDVIKMVNE